MVHFKIKYKIYTLTMKIAHDFFMLTMPLFAIGNLLEVL
jgi:hypothetical protein